MLFPAAFIAAFDLDSAFPSVDQDWIHIVLEAYGVPLGSRRLVSAYYACCASFDSAGQLLFFLLSGVFQGCPLSGMLFDVSVDPFIIAFKKITF